MDLNERGRRALERFRAHRSGPRPFLDRSTVVMAVTLALLIAGAAWWGQRFLADGVGVAREDLSGFSVFLHRQGCPGQCPVYAVLIKSDGAGGAVVEYEGVTFVATEGPQRATLDGLALRALSTAARRSGIEGAAAAIKPGTEGCGSWRNGLELLQLGVTRRDSTYTVDLYPGCDPGDPRLIAFAREIDALAGTARWVNP